jgi:hypothetical protein
VAKISLLLDEDVHLPLSSALRKRGFDVIHAQESDRKGKTDSEQLEFATENEMCILSYNVRDFVMLHNNYVDLDKEHWGIIISKQLPIGETLTRILKLFQISSKESMKNNLEFL